MFRLQPHAAAIISTMGLIQFYQENYDEARALFDKSTALDPSEESAYFGRTAILIEQSDYATAIAEIDKLIRVQPQNAQAFFRRGFAYLRANQPLKALADFDTALELDPELKETTDIGQMLIARSTISTKP